MVTSLPSLRSRRPPSRSASATTRSTSPGSSGGTTRSASGSWASPTSGSPSSRGPGSSRARASSIGPGSTTRCEALADAGRLIVMCTPTATPPAWLIRKHPEILPVDDGRPRPQLRLAQALRPRQPHLPRALPPHHDRDRRALRAASGRRRLADRQRVRLPRHGALLRSGQPRRLPRLAGSALRDARGAERGLGQRLLEPGVHRLGPDRPAKPDGGPAEPLARARLLPLRQRRDRRLPGGAGRDPAPALARALGDPQLHDALPRLRPLPGRGVPRLRLVGLLSPRSGRALPAGGGEGALGADRTPRPDLVQPRSLPRSEGPARLLGDGAGGRAGQLGALQLPAGGGSGGALDGAGLRPRLRRRQLLPLAGGDGRPGADALRSAPPRRDARPGRRGGRRARAERPPQRRRADARRPPPRLREPLDLRRAAAQRRGELLGPGDALLRRAALARRRRRHPAPGRTTSAATGSSSPRPCS